MKTRRTFSIAAPLIVDVKGNSLDDGPGIRSVIFFKGCPLNCVWCHNPEAKRKGPELSFDEKKCVRCRACEDACPQGFISQANNGFIDRQRCAVCFACSEICPSGALSRVGRMMTVNKLVERVALDKPFYDTSGGGVTLSGGEPTLFMDFVSQLLVGLKRKRIHTLIETCGQFDLEQFEHKLYPYLDMIYYDLKIFDDDEHRRSCGVSNRIILENFTGLANRSRNRGPKVIPRIPLIPGITDTEQNISALAGFLRGNGIPQAQVLEYNPLWHEKCSMVGQRDMFEGVDTLTTWMNGERILHCKEMFRMEGVEV